MTKSTRFDNLDAIENNIRRRLEQLDQIYQRDRALLEEELRKFENAKRSVIQFVDKYGGEEIDVIAFRAEEVPAGSGHAITFNEMPWGRYASGIDKVIYVIKEAGDHGLSRQEIIDQIEKISGVRIGLNSVTTWLYRGKKRGQIGNRRKRWYIAQDP